MSEDRVREIQQRVEKATPGPWSVFSHESFREIIVDAEEPRSVITQGEIAGRSIVSVSAEDAEFIAHSREDIPYLLSRLQAAETQVEQLVGDVRACVADYNDEKKLRLAAESRIQSLTEAHMKAVREIHLLHARAQLTVEPLAECGYCQHFLLPPVAHNEGIKE